MTEEIRYIFELVAEERERREGGNERRTGVNVGEGRAFNQEREGGVKHDHRVERREEVRERAA